MNVFPLGRRAVTAPLAALLAAALLVGLMPPPALADTPNELDWLCVENDDKVFQATQASDCSRRQVAVDVPATRPVHLCGRDDFGLVRWTADPSACTRDHEFPITIPDSGPLILCSKNIKNGRLQPTGELRFADDVARCDSKFYTPFITPAAPEAVPDTYTVDEDTLLTVAARGVLDNDADASGGPLTAHLVADTDVGSVGLGSDGGFTWDPRGLFEDLDAGQSRDVHFTYLTSDGELASEPTSVTITVTGRNDVPVATADTFTTDEDTALQVVQPGVLANDTDAEAGLLSAHLVEDVAAGTLQLAADGGLHYHPSDAFEHLGTGERADMSFTYVARDGHDDSAPATVGIAVTGVNDPPVGTADAFTTDENTPIEITPGQLLANDTDAEGTPLTVVDVVTGTPADAFAVTDGTVTLDPRAAFDDLEDGQSRTATFSYAASDDELTSGRTAVTITVTGISPPRPVDDRADTDEDTPVEIAILANDGVAGADVAVDATGSLGSAVSYVDGIATFDPRGKHDDLPPGALRRETFTYSLTNPEATAIATVEVLIEGRADAPVANDDEHAPVAADAPTDFLGNKSVLFNDTDADDDATLRAILVSPPELGRLTLDPESGEFTFDPAGELAAGGKVTFRYRASDGTLESPTATVTLDTTADSAPVLVNQEFFYFLGDPLPTFQVEASDTGPLDYSLPLGSADFTIDADTGVISFLGEVPGVGRYPLEVQVVDTASQSATATVTIVVAHRVSPTDDPYDAIGNTPLVLGQPFDGIAVSVAGSVLDNDGAAGDVSTSSQNLDTTLGGRVALRTDGTFTYTPPRPRPAGVVDACDPGASVWDGSTSAEDTFRYDVFDADGDLVGTPTVTITLAAVVWYVDPELAGAPTDPAGCGTSTDPYVDVAALSALDGGPDSPGDVIHVLSGTTGSGITLEDDQRLTGAGVDLVAGDMRLLAATPTEPTTIGGPVRLAQDNTLRGFAVVSPAEGLVAARTSSGDLSGVGAATVDLPQVTATSGPALQLGPGTPSVQIDTVSHTGVSDALELRGTGGTVTIGSLTGQGPAVLTGGPTRATVDIGTLALSVSRPDDPAAADGLAVSDLDGMVTVGRLAVDLTGTALAVDNLAETGTVTVGRVERTHAAAAAPATGMTMTDNGGDVAIGHATLDVALRGDADRGLAVVKNTGTVVIAGGVISASPPGPGVEPVLAEVHRGTGTLLNEADVRLGTPTAPASGSAARALVVSNLGAGARVEQRGEVVDRGAGMAVTGTASDSLVLLSGASDVAVVDSVGLSAMNTGPVAVTGPSHRFSSTGGPAVILSSVELGDAGITIGQATSTDSPRSEDPVVEHPDFPGVGIEVDAVTTDGPGVLQVLAGQVDRPAVAGVRVQASPGTIIGAVRVSEPGEVAGVSSSGVGVDVLASPGAVLQRASVFGAPSVGVQVADSPNAVLDGITVDSSHGVGISLPNPDGTTVLRGTHVRDSRLVGLHIIHDDASAARTLVLENSTVSGSPPEQHSIHVDASSAQPLSFTMGGATGSASVGGDHSLLVNARQGAQVQLALTRARFGSSGDDAVRVVADGTGSTVQVSATDMTATTAGGVLNAGGAGIALVGQDGGVIAGSLQRVDVTQSTTFGVLLDNVADGFVLDQLGVFAPEQVGIGVQSSDGVRINQSEVQGAPAGHGIEVFLAHGLDIRRTRVDLSGLPDPNPPQPKDRPGTYLPATLNDTCTANPSRLNGPSQVEQLTVYGVAGIYARHVTGDVDLRDTTVLGATLHQVVVHNGDTLPGVADPAGRPTPTASEGARTLHLRVQDLHVLKSDPERAALFVGADGTTSPGTITIELLPGTIDTDAPPLFCALAGARLRVVTEQRTVQRDGRDVIEPSGTLTFPLRTVRPALIMKTSNKVEDPPTVPAESRIDYDLRNVEYLWGAGVPAGEYTPAVEEDTTEGGTIVGSESDVTITDAPGDAFVAESNTTIRGLRIVNPAGDGLIIRDVSNVTAINVTVEEPGRHGVLVERSSDVGLTTVNVTRPGGAGVWATDSDFVAATDLTVTNPGGPGVHLASVSSARLTDATLTSSIPGPDGPRSGVRALNAVPLSLSRVSADGFDATPIDIVVGTSHPDATELPSCPDACAGTVELRGLMVSQTDDEDTDDEYPVPDPAVRIRTGPGSNITTELGDSAGRGTVLDAPLTVASSGTATRVTAEDATFEIAGSDGLRFSADDPGTLTADLSSVTLTRGPDAPGSGVGLLLDGVTATLTDTTITGAYERGISGTGSDLTVTGGSIAGAAAEGVVAGGGGALDLMGASVSGGAEGVAAFDLDRVHVGARAVAGAPSVRTMIDRGLHVEGVGDVDIREADISRADGASGVTVFGGGPGQCTTLVGNAITPEAATAPAFRLTDVSLEGLGLQSVDDYLTAHGNTPATVEASDVGSC